MRDTKASSVSFVLLLNRLSLGVLFVLAGVRKLLPTAEANIIDKMNGFAAFTASKAPLPEVLGKAYGYALPWVEIICGAMLVIGFFSRLAATLIGLMLVSFLIAMGPEWWPESGPAFSKNFILLTLCCLLAISGSGRFAFKPDGLLK